jgi:hypothetical protein
MTASQIAAVAGIVAAVFAVLDLVHGVWVRWPRLSLSWRREHAGVSSGPGGSDVTARLEIENHGGATARHAVVDVHLDDKLREHRTLSIAPDSAVHVDVRLVQPDQAQARDDGTIDVHGHALRARVTYRRTRWLWRARPSADFPTTQT